MPVLHEELRLHGWRRSAIHADLGGIPRLHGTERHPPHVVLQKQRKNQEHRRQLGPELAEFELVSMNTLESGIRRRAVPGQRDGILRSGRSEEDMSELRSSMY